MRVLVHDYSGHPFQVQLTRKLALRGMTTRHVFSTSFQTPKGDLERRNDDPEGFDVVPLSLAEPFVKDSFVRRRSQEIEFGRLVAAQVTEFKPDVVISSNAPLDCQKMIWRECTRLGIPKIFWLQDIYSEAILRILSKKLPVVGHFVGLHYQRMEYDMLRRAEHVVAISEDFLPIITQHGVDPSRTTVVENWAPLADLTPQPRDNAWAQEHMSADRPRVVYSGTLGMKHNPEHLITIAKSCPEADVYVFSEGAAASEVARRAERDGISNLHVRPWIPFKCMPDMLSGADILMVLLEEDAGLFSVPSKVLTYATMGRPICASIPEANLASQIITRNEMGLIAAPSRPDVLAQHVRSLINDPARREVMGRGARAYAERTFDIEAITDSFQTILEQLGSKA
ncbi:glycosyltransferase family 4 protein [Roseinatronobacter sp. S2]|uniref:glycosyltransferase family 4 protein n=1 Tax=Roseinatronobacter sp. S2 TaxID=3035471 RepID=UPI002410253B|nr:glycosyltransferase family 4 protein [Roseinatronobacter sp. S2]WFE75348.1 glycosyltransferase family 4 protein [Roseinatronobacter sp. S2]